MKLKKRVFNGFELFECDAMAEYLELMAKKGWMLTSLGVMLSFKKIQPTDLKFEVNTMEKTSVFDSLKNEKILRARKLYEDAGWDFVCTNGILQVHVSNKPDMIPVQENSELKGKLILKTVMSKTIPIYLMLLVLCSFYLLMLTRDINYLWSNFSLISIGSFLYLGILSICQLTIILVWYFKGKRDLSRGKVINYPKYKMVRKRSNILISTLVVYVIVSLILMFTAIKGQGLFLWIFLIYLVCYGGMLLILKWVLKLLREKYNFNRKINRLVYIFSGVLIGIVITVIVISGTFRVIRNENFNRILEQTSNVVPVVTNELLGYESGDISRHRKEESMIASREIYNEIRIEGELYYYVDYEYYTSRLTYALNRIRDNHMKMWQEMGYIPFERINITGHKEAELYVQPRTYNDEASDIHRYEYLIKNKKSLMLLQVPEKLADKELIAIIEKMK